MDITNHKTMEHPNIFLYGLSGAGKDTLADYLRDNYDYLKLRTAGTIKQFVFETYGFKTQSEFEKAKRTISEVRKAHNKFSSEQYIMHSELNTASTNRVKQIIDKESFEFEIVKDLKSKPICVSDVRYLEHIVLLMMAGYKAVFLTRRANEYADTKHESEQYIFNNIESLKVILKCGKKDQIYLVFNNNETTEMIEQYINTLEQHTNKKLISKLQWKKIGETGTTDNSLSEADKLFQFKTTIEKIINNNYQT